MVKFVRALLSLALRSALAIGLVCVLAALASLAGRASFALDLLSHFVPFWFAGSLVVAACAWAVASRGWRIALVGAGALGVAASILLILPEMTRPIRPPLPSQPSRQIKLIQFNAWEKNADPEQAASWLAAQAPDFILMEDAEAPISQALVKRGFLRRRGMLDTAIFSRAPPLSQPFWIKANAWQDLPGFARATFAGPDGPFSIVAVHLKRPYSPHQLPQAQALAAVLDGYDHRTLIVAGDFNLTPWSFGLHWLDGRLGLERRDRALFTWPAQVAYRHRLLSPTPFLPLDHVYAGEAWRTVKIERGPWLGSDHYPVVVTLALAK
jgi:endonuclease/exonuclease/phosphatase (EEP) superfamily protein YafD